MKYPDDSNELEDTYIEVSNLADSEQEEHADKYLPAEQRISLKARYTKKERRKKIIITASIILVLLLLLIGGNISLQQIQQIFSGRASTPAPPLNGTPSDAKNLFYFQTLPSWGKLTLDGQLLPPVPTLTGERPLALPNGKHVLEWQAEPFKTQSCTLMVPPDSEKQTCQTELVGTNAYALQASLVKFQEPLTLKQLPEPEQEGLIKAAQSLLDSLQSSEVVQVGERYAYNQNANSIHIAQVPLNAQQSFILETDPTKPANCVGLRLGSGCAIDNNDCRLFCTLTWPQDLSGSDTNGWNVAAVLHREWSYTPQDQQDTKEQKDANEQGDQRLVAFQIKYENKQWSVKFHPQQASSFDDPNCLSTMGTIVADPIYRYIADTQQRVNWNFISGNKRASGCLAAAKVNTEEDQGSTLGGRADAYLIEHLGVLYAVDGRAQQLWPKLPIADQHIREIAREIEQEPAFIS